MRKLCCFLFFIIPILSFSQVVDISGNASFYANETIQVSYYTNLLTKTTQLIQETEISDNGEYHLQFEIKEPVTIVLKLEMRELELEIYPDSKINLNFLPIVNADNQRVPLRIGIKTISSKPHLATYQTYQDLEIDFANYQSAISINEKMSAFYTHFFDSIQLELNAILTSDSLFSKHYKYFKANAFLQSEISKNDLFQTYLNDQPIEYNNAQYLLFLKALSFRLIHKNFSKNIDAIESASQQYQVYQSFMDVLAEEPLLQNEEIRSLGLLMYCFSNEQNPILSNELKNGIINQISNFCIYPTQKMAAQIFQKNRNRFDIGNEAPDFELYNTNGDLKKLSSFRGRTTYLGFINSKSITCGKDLQVVENIRRKYRKVKFLFVVCDRDSLQMQNLPNESSAIQYLYINKNYTALEEYQVWNFPVYYLLDKHGYFIQSPAKNPENIIEDFKKLFANKSGRKRYEIIKD